MFIGRFKQRLTISKLRPKELLIPSSICFYGPKKALYSLRCDDIIANLQII